MRGVELVNELQERAFGSDQFNITEAELTLDFLIDERARELHWECHRRTDLVRFETLSSLAVDFTKSLAHHNRDITKASWFIEYSRARFDVYTPPDIPEMQTLLSDENLLNEAYALIWPEVREYKLTYWRDTFSKIGL